ncbi:MAG TPA: DUF3108 domain-containing protein, partial [Acidobacteriaceae bacterium]
MRTTTVLLARMVLVPLLAVAQAAPPVAVPLIPPQPGYSYPAHLTLNYAVDWRVFPAGTSSFHLEQQGDEERVTASGDTLGAINLIYRVS